LQRCPVERKFVGV
jgi:hypothetical protein